VKNVRVKLRKLKGLAEDKFRLALTVLSVISTTSGVSLARANPPLAANLIAIGLGLAALAKQLK